MIIYCNRQQKSLIGKTSILGTELSGFLFAVISILIIIFFYRDYKKQEKIDIIT